MWGHSRFVVLVVICAALFSAGCGGGNGSVGGSEGGQKGVTLEDIFDDLRQGGWSLDVFEMSEDDLKENSATEGFRIRNVGYWKVVLIRMDPGVDVGIAWDLMQELLDAEHLRSSIIDGDGPRRIAAYTHTDNNADEYKAFLRDLKKSYNSRAK